MLLTGKLLEFSLLFSKILYKTDDIYAYDCVLGQCCTFHGHLELTETAIYIVCSCTYVTLTSSAHDSKQREYVIGGNFTMFTKLVIFYAWNRFENLSQKFQMFQQKGIIIWFESSGTV